MCINSYLITILHGNLEAVKSFDDTLENKIVKINLNDII